LAGRIIAAIGFFGNTKIYYQQFAGCILPFFSLLYIVQDIRFPLPGGNNARKKKYSSFDSHIHPAGFICQRWGGTGLFKLLLL